MPALMESGSFQLRDNCRHRCARASVHDTVFCCQIGTSSAKSILHDRSKPNPILNCVFLQRSKGFFHSLLDCVR